MREGGFEPPRLAAPDPKFDPASYTARRQKVECAASKTFQQARNLPRRSDLPRVARITATVVPQGGPSVKPQKHLDLNVANFKSEMAPVCRNFVGSAPGQSRSYVPHRSSGAAEPACLIREEVTRAAVGQVTPPLKWAGGKRWLVPHLRRLWNRHRQLRLVEPESRLTIRASKKSRTQLGRFDAKCNRVLGNFDRWKMSRISGLNFAQY
jgi:hypothetical protein